MRSVTDIDINSVMYGIEAGSTLIDKYAYAPRKHDNINIPIDPPRIISYGFNVEMSNIMCVYREQFAYKYLPQIDIFGIDTALQKIFWMFNKV